ncbi:MAG TPA: DNA-3-methyladenine glycosylase [Burkholderiales bacterium]|nr:DNA-3-methyladenine glycosylase [Burkholderiales bacterium]
MTAVPAVPPVALTPAYWARAKRELARNDPLLDAVLRAHPGAVLRSRGDAFQTLMRSIVGQQISLKAADSVWARLCLAVAPRPADVIALGHERLAACGLSQRKAEYILDLARHFAEGRLHIHRWPEMDDEAVIQELIAVRGIGRWTAEMFLMFNLLRPDVLPVDDLGLRRAVSELYFGGEPIGADAVRHVARDWAPWRSVATWYLWRSLEPVPVEY